MAAPASIPPTVSENTDKLSLCPHCQAVLSLPLPTHCPVCHKPLTASNQVGSVTKARWLAYGFLFGLLGLLLLMHALATTPYYSVMLGDVVLSVFVLAFALPVRKELAPLLQRKGISTKVITTVLVLTPLAAGAVMLLERFIVEALFKDIYIIDEAFDNRGAGFSVAVILIAIQPAVFEELAFRGFLFTYLGRFMSPRYVLWVTTLTFALIHFNWVGLVWLVPLGYAFGWLRQRYNTLLYSMVAHFTYNFSIIMLHFFLSKL